MPKCVKNPSNIENHTSLCDELKSKEFITTRLSYKKSLEEYHKTLETMNNSTTEAVSGYMKALESAKDCYDTPKDLESSIKSMVSALKIMEDLEAYMLLIDSGISDTLLSNLAEEEGTKLVYTELEHKLASRGFEEGNPLNLLNETTIKRFIKDTRDAFKLNIKDPSSHLQKEASTINERLKKLRRGIDKTGSRLYVYARAVTGSDEHLNELRQLSSLEKGVSAGLKIREGVF